MSLVLERGTKPAGLRIKTLGLLLGDPVWIGDYEISMEDFLFAAHYVLTNTNLRPNDPRLQFVKSVQAMKVVPGQPTIIGSREFPNHFLQTDVPPVLDQPQPDQG